MHVKQELFSKQSYLESHKATNNTTKIYIESTSTTFKDRYRNGIIKRASITEKKDQNTKYN